jgi:serine/threonine protein kinase
MIILAGGRYQLEEVIGKGGFATVWRGYDTALAVHRAVKLLHPTLSGSQSVRDRLRAEARAMAKLAHPNILTVHDIGEQEGQDWFVMDLVEGGSLADWQSRGGRLPPKLAVHCTIQVLSALAAAHAAGIVHRDVKPQNVLMEADGRCRLADFGIALLESEELLRSTKTGAMMGSLSFMAPEQRLNARDVGPTADLYATGSTLYSLLTNANAIDLFTADGASARWALVPAPLLPILQRATQLDPAARYEDAAAMVTALREAEADLVGDWDTWLEELDIPRVSGADTHVPQTMQRVENSTRAALTFMGLSDDGQASPPTAVPATRAAEATVFTPPEPAEGSVEAPSPKPAEAPHPEEDRPRPVLPWLAPVAATAVLAGGLWLWSPWSAPTPNDTESLAPIPTEPEPEPAAEPVNEPVDEPEHEHDNEVDPEPPPPDDAVAKLEPEPAPPTQPTAQEAVTPADPTPPAATTSTVGGRWQGSYGGKDAVLQLTGPDEALSGSLTITFFGNEQSSQVRGRLEGDRLLLEDQDRSDSYAGRHLGTLGADGRIVGQTTTFTSGRVVSFSFWR